MGLRDVLKKKDRSASDAPVPEFTLIRSDTYTQEVVYPPGGDPPPQHNNPGFLSSPSPSSPPASQRPRRSMDIFHSSRSRSGSASSRASDATQQSARRESRLSRLGLGREPKTSEHVPADLPEIRQGGVGGDAEEVETQWEKRAMILATSRPSSPGAGGGASPGGGLGGDAGGGAGGRARAGTVSSKAIDEDIQRAIRFHEEGNLAESTRLFGRLADPSGANNPLSQVLYGLALRHGWGCAPDPDAAVRYLSKAASNSAAVEEMALQAGLKKGGAAKGELVLAIFELANCFRHGWGIGKDPVAAKQYYETAANLGDTDAMNEAAWCYLEGFGCKKDKFAAARYYRLAEKNGNKTLGNSWIWKEKYGPPEDATAGKK